MRKYLTLLALALAIFSCENEPDTQPAVYYDFVPGAIQVEFVDNAKLKSAFELVNQFQLEISLAYGSIYFSKLPADSIGYIMKYLKTKTYLNNEKWHFRENGGVYTDPATGKVALLCLMEDMDETRQTDWAITAAVLGLDEQPAVKSFLLHVPKGQELYWCQQFRLENIVLDANLLGTIGYN